MEEKYIKDASLLIKHAKDRRHKDIIPRTNLQPQSNPFLPTFTQIRDGFKNLVSGLGGLQAKSTYTTYRTTFCMTDQLLYSLYESNGLSRKICEVIPKDATKNNIKIQNDIEQNLLKKWKKLKAKKCFKQAGIYQRFFGGALIYIDIDDGRELWEPVNYNSIKSIRKLRVYSRTDVFFTNVHFTEDIRSENYGQPEFYTVVPKYTTPFNIHYTRVLEFKGLDVPIELDNGYRYYWGQSVVEVIWESLKKVGAAIENLDQLLYEMTIAIYKIKGLADLICNKEWNTIKTIIDQTELAKSTIRSLLIDAEGHDYKRDSLSFPGVKDVIELLFTLLSGESYISMLRLFGKQLGGLNNEAKGELTIYYDEVDEFQEHSLTDQAQQLIDYINISKEIGGKKVSEPIVEWESPYQLTQKEELENKKIQSEIDKTYSDIGSITEREVRELRFENGWTYDTDITELESYEEILEEPEPLELGEEE